MGDTVFALDDQEELEDEAEAEVDKVLWELTAGKLGEAPAAVVDSLPPSAEREPAGASAVDDKEEDEEELMGRLEALRS
ncbi:hypothetical protein ScPMuIL_001637 [Solemya velum]